MQIEVLLPGFSLAVYPSGLFIFFIFFSFSLFIYIHLSICLSSTCLFCSVSLIFQVIYTSVHLSGLQTFLPMFPCVFPFPPFSLFIYPIYLLCLFPRVFFLPFFSSLLSLLRSVSFLELSRGSRVSKTCNWRSDTRY